MFTINNMPEQISPVILNKLAKVETATVGHFFHQRFMDLNLQALVLGQRVAGTAVTVSIPGRDSALLHHILGLVRPGDFLVIDRCGDFRHACWGGVVTLAAKMQGVVGAVIDGVATDFEEIRTCEMPIWCRGLSPLTTQLLAVSGSLNTPVSCGGVVVHPGDAILADENGILVLRPDEIVTVVDKALNKQDREKEVIKRIRAGEKLPEISGATAKIEAAQATTKLEVP